MMEEKVLIGIHGIDYVVEKRMAVWASVIYTVSILLSW